MATKSEIKTKTINSLNKLVDLIQNSEASKKNEFTLKLKIKETIELLKEYEKGLNSPSNVVVTGNSSKPSENRVLSKPQSSASVTNSQELQISNPACSSAIKDRIKLFSAKTEEPKATTIKKEPPKRTVSAGFDLDDKPKPYRRQISHVDDLIPKDPPQIQQQQERTIEIHKPEPEISTTIFAKKGSANSENGQLEIFQPIPLKFQTLIEIDIQNFEIEPQILLNFLKPNGETLRSIKLINVVLIGTPQEKINLPVLENFEISLCFKNYLPVCKSVLKALIFWDTAVDASVEFDSLRRLGVDIDIRIRERRILRIKKGTMMEFVKNYSMVGENDDVIHPPTSDVDIAAQSELKSLALRNCTIEIPLLTIPPNLTHLNLYQMELIGGDIDAVLRKMEYLQDLRLTPLIDRLIFNMASLPADTLKYLCVYNVEIKYSRRGNSGIIEDCFPQLTTLGLDFCSMNEEIVNNFSQIFPNVKRICLFDPTKNNSNYLLLLEILKMPSMEWIWFDKFKDPTFRMEDFLKSINKVLKQSGSELRSEEIVEDCDHWVYFNLEKESGTNNPWKFVKKNGPAKTRFDMFGMEKFWTSFEAFQKETVRVMGQVKCCEGTLTV